MKQITPNEMVSVQWHLALCKPNQHHIATASLSRLECEVFLPLQKMQRRWRGSLFDDLRPVFPGYVFVGVDPRRPIWHLLRMAYGVSRIIGFGPYGPAEVPEAVIAGLMARCDSDGVLRPHQEQFAEGDHIRIISGPFADFVTQIDKIEPDHRLHVLLELLGRSTRVVIDPAVAVRRA